MQTAESRAQKRGPYKTLFGPIGEPHSPERNAYNTARANRRKKQIDVLKLNFGGCSDCGYNGAAEALDFDRRPGEIKTFNITKGRTFGWGLILDEISKCDLVCANCHRIRTKARYGR
jgi:hypothetical protein